MSDKIIEKLETIEKLFKQNLIQYRQETVKQIESIWKDQTRQDGTIQELLQQKAICLEEFDNKIKASEIDTNNKVEKTEKNWWKKVGLIYGVVILILGVLFTLSISIKNEVSAKLGKDEFYQWKRTELSDVKQEIRDLRKEIKDDLKDFSKSLDEHLKKLEENSKNLNKNRRSK